MAFRLLQGFDDEMRLILIGQDDHLAGPTAVLHVAHQLAHRVHFRLVRLTVDVRVPEERRAV